MIGKHPDVTWSDEDLVGACRAGNQLAWAALVEKYKKLVFSIPVKYQLPPDEAADVFQGVWIDLYRDLYRLERVAGLRGWLATAAARRSMLHKKRRQHVLNSGELDPEVPDNSHGVYKVLAEAEREQQLRAAIARLPERCRRMVKMLFYEHPPRPYSEVARELGLAQGSIGFIRGRCLEKLRKLFQQSEEPS
jgi:RNA polymerase sigma factor (sigma-70 family)